MERYQQVIAVEPDVTILIRAHGNLDVHQWERPELGIVTDINVQKIRHESKLLRLLFVEDCELSVPSNRELIIDRVSDNARLKDLQNPLTINKVGGRLALQNVNSAVVGRVSDSCLLENIRGSLKIGKIGDQLTGKNLVGSISIERVSGEAKLQGVGGALDIRGDDNIEVSLLDSNREKINIRSSDSIKLHLPAEPDASLQIRSGGESILLETGALKKKMNEGRSEIRLGNGGQKIVLDAGDRVQITSDVPDAKEITRLFEDLDTLWNRLKAESELRRAAREKESRWEIKMVEGAARIAHEALDEVEDFSNQISDDAIREAQLRVKEAMKQVEEQIRNLGYDLSVVGEAHERQSEAGGQENQMADVSDEEKLVVMRLLQQQKISVEEADRLLQVLSEAGKPGLAPEA